jgi:hypothetical protein
MPRPLYLDGPYRAVCDLTGALLLIAGFLIPAALFVTGTVSLWNALAGNLPEPTPLPIPAIYAAPCASPIAGVPAP